MKKTLIISFLAVVLIALVCVIIFTPPEKDETDVSILWISSKTELDDYIRINDITSYSKEEDYTWLWDVELFGEQAILGFHTIDDTMDKVEISFDIFREAIGEETVTMEEILNYQFSNREKEKINQSFEGIMAGFEAYIGCDFKSYDVIPTRAVADRAETEENFFNGVFLKEYSVRDRNGVLWIMRYEASFGSASVRICKILDETGYEGFIPAVDLTKSYD